MTPQEILMACCCKDSGTRYEMRYPFRLGNQVFATNGHIAAWVPHVLMPDAGAVKNPPPVTNLPLALVGETVSLPDPEKHPTADCPDCGGTGTTEEFVTCSNCECETKSGHLLPCLDCWGMKNVMTNGLERLLEPRHIIIIPVGDVWLQSVYIRQLWSWGVRSVVVSSKKTNIRTPVKWYCGEVQGLLMPCEKPLQAPA